MLRKIFNPKVCVALIVAALVISICFVPFTTSNFMDTSIHTGALLVLCPILLGIIYCIVVSFEPEIKKNEESKLNGFGIAYACIFTVFYALNIWVIIYAVTNMKP